MDKSRRINIRLGTPQAAFNPPVERNSNAHDCDVCQRPRYDIQMHYGGYRVCRECAYNIVEVVLSQPDSRTRLDWPTIRTYAANRTLEEC